MQIEIAEHKQFEVKYRYKRRKYEYCWQINKMRTWYLMSDLVDGDLAKKCETLQRTQFFFVLKHLNFFRIEH